MHVWWIKMKEYAKNEADIEVAREKCLQENLQHQIDCGDIYCDAGEHKDCGGFCKKHDRGSIYLTPLNNKDFFQAGEKDTKERKAKKAAREREMRQKKAALKEIE